LRLLREIPTWKYSEIEQKLTRSSRKLLRMMLMPKEARAWDLVPSDLGSGLKKTTQRKE
jgi:hypothetical protein